MENSSYILQQARRIIVFFFFVVFFHLSIVSQNNHDKVELALEDFSLADVHLEPSSFYSAMLLNKSWLLSFDPDRFLSGFRLESGLIPKAPKYGGWESQGVAGQTFGHYLSALSMMYVSTGDDELNNRIIYSINELDSCQQAFNLGGLVAAFPRAHDLFSEIARGDIRTEGFDLNGGWVPLYSMHKLFAGLIDVYRYTNNQQAYKILLNMAEGLNTMLGSLTDDQIQKILICEHGGINESMAEVYALTKEKRFLELAMRLNHKAVLYPLSRGVDDLAGKHANTQIPKVLGVIREYELTGDEGLLETADFFWNRVVHHHSYVIGGNSEAEHFGIADRIADRITDKTCENCNTYNMLKLTKHLYMLNPTIEKADFYERALYNQILASQNPEDGMVCYMSPLSTGSKRNFSTPFDSFWCCVGTGLENHSRYGEFIYFTDKHKDLYVNLFIPSELDWKARNIKVKQSTSFPQSDITELSLSMRGSQRFALNLRLPSWANGVFEVEINGEKINIPVSPIGYVSINRHWRNGDVIKYRLVKEVWTESALGESTLKAYLYGPIVLSGIFNDGEASTFFPVIEDEDQKTDVNRLSDTTLDFELKSVYPRAIKMKPYNQMKTDKLMVYFPHYTKEYWKARGESILKRQDYERWSKEQEVSHFRPGEMQPERDHNFEGTNIEVGEIEGRKYRKALSGGEFSFDMDVIPHQSQYLVMTYWGNLGDIYKFSVEVDGESIATVIIHWWGNQFIDKVYPIPSGLVGDKNRIRVSLRALDDKSVAGPLFDCKIIKE